MEGSNYRSAEDPFSAEGKNYHLGISSQQIAPTVLLPGDPGRVSVISREWDSWQVICVIVNCSGYARAFRVGMIARHMEGSPRPALTQEEGERIRSNRSICLSGVGVL